MSVFRVHKINDYTIMSNTHFREKDMTLKAKGLLSLMLSLPDDWDYSISGLMLLSKDGKDSVISALNELEKFHYLNRTQIIDKKGHFSGYDYDIFEKPQSEISRAEKPNTGNPYTENHAQLNTNIFNTKELSTNILKERKGASRKTSFDCLIEDYCNKNDQEKAKSLLQDWLKVRKAKRAAMTDRAIQLNLDKLNDMAAKSNLTVEKYLEEVIMRGWQAFYPIIQYGRSNKKGKVYNYDASIDEIFGIGDEDDE